jgi:hypothetical protein
MSRRLPAAVIAAVAIAALAAYVGLWSEVSRADIGASDFTASYVGGTLLREGHGAAIYDEGLQAALHASLVAPDRHGNLPFVNPPAAAVLVAPLTLLSLPAAYRLWQVAQLLMLALALLVAARAAPWPRELRRRGAVGAVALAAFAGTGTLALGLLAQWDGLSALGVAAAYALWRRQAGFAAGVVLALSASVAKPHLAIGLAALLLGWRERRTIAGALTGVAVAVAVSLAAVGPSGLIAFAAAARTDATRWPLASLLGFNGLSGSWLGDGAAAQVIGAACSAAALVACVVLGRRLARGRIALEPCLAAALLLSLVASPHLLAHDLVLLAPALVALAAWAARGEGWAAWPGRTSRAILVGWLVLCLVAAVDLGSQQPAPPGRLVPLALAGLAAPLAWRRRDQPSSKAAASVPSHGSAAI